LFGGIQFLFQKILASFKNGVIGHGTWMIAGSAIQSGSAFGANLVLVRFLLPEDFGRFAIVMANIGLVQSVVSLPVATIVLRTPETELESKLSLFAAVNIIQNLVVFWGGLLILLAVGKFDIKSFLLLISSVSSNWIQMQMKLYERKFHYRQLSLLEAISHIFSHLFAVIGALIGLGAVVLYARGLVQELHLILGLKWLNGLQAIPLRWLKLKDWQVLFQEVRGFWANGFLANSFERVVILTVGAMAGDQGTGYFFQARRLSIVPHQILQPITHRISINYLSNRVSAEKRETLVLKGLIVISSVIIPIALGIAIIADPIIPILFGSKWKPIVPIFIAMLGFLIGITLFSFVKSYFVARGMMKTLIFLGRGAQYVGFILVAIIVSTTHINPVIGLAIGLSASSIIASILLIVKIISIKNSVSNLNNLEK
jgi:PST family polysaccharide transporter